jgi:hypothetical protein
VYARGGGDPVEFSKLQNKTTTHPCNNFLDGSRFNHDKQTPASRKSAGVEFGDFLRRSMIFRFFLCESITRTSFANWGQI